MFGFEEENNFAVGYIGRLCVHEQHRHDPCRSPAGIIHAHLISSLPSMLLCLLSLQHFSLTCASEHNIFVSSNALIYPKLPWIVLLGYVIKSSSPYTQRRAEAHGQGRTLSQPLLSPGCHRRWPALRPGWTPITMGQGKGLQVPLGFRVVGEGTSAGK